MKYLPVFLCLPILFSCASAGRDVYLPGEKERILRNIASEYYAIAEAYADLKRFDKAAAYYELAKRDSEFFRAAYYKQGRMYALNKDWHKARRVFEELISEDGDNMTLALSLAYVTAMEGDTESALAQYRALLSEHPYEPDILINTIYLLLASGNLDSAEAHFRVLQERFPENGSLSAVEKKIQDAAAETGQNEQPEKSPEMQQQSDSTDNKSDSGAG